MSFQKSQSDFSLRLTCWLSYPTCFRSISAEPLRTTKTVVKALELCQPPIREGKISPRCISFPQWLVMQLISNLDIMLTSRSLANNHIRLPSFSERHHPDHAASTRVQLPCIRRRRRSPSKWLSASKWSRHPIFIKVLHLARRNATCLKVQPEPSSTVRCFSVLS